MPTDENDLKPLSLKDRWQFDIADRDKMYQENPPEPFRPTEEQIERYKKEFGLDITVKEHNITLQI